MTSLSELDFIRPVDVAAFRNLVDSAEKQYLMTRLTKYEFRTVQRLRLRAALDYLARAKHNRSILLSLGKSARRDHNPKVSAAARDVVASARRLWINALLATCAIYAEIALPETQISMGQVAERYEDFTDRVVRLKQLQDLLLTVTLRSTDELPDVGE